MKTQFGFKPIQILASVPREMPVCIKEGEQRKFKPRRRVRVSLVSLGVLLIVVPPFYYSL